MVKHTFICLRREELRTSLQQWLREGVNFKPSAVLCSEREAGGEMRASNAGEESARG